MESVADEFQLSADERAELIPSGQENLLLNRLAWARTYLGKAGLVESPKRGLVQITERGRIVLAERPSRVDNTTLSRFPEFIAWISRSARPEPARPDLTGVAELPLHFSGMTTPREQIDVARREMEAALRAELVERVQRMSPSEFELLIVKLLVAMGYGQGQAELAQAIGGAGDGGMDGVVHQDPLGLERVYIQAKRWKEGNNVSSPEIRNFVGALNIHRANKGVFVTASQFTSDARQAAQSSTVQVVLIDGERLAELMVRYKVGVLVRDTIEIKGLDEGFFGD